MWSGPRNLSTAMMYSFAQRADSKVVDEPFYAAYLAKTGLPHPMAVEVMNSQPQDPFVVEQSLISSIDAEVHYQKHMCQHMIDGMPRDWMAEVTNVFLIRHPARVIASFAKQIPNPTAQDIGFEAQVDLFNHCVALGQSPVVVDSFDIRQNPEVLLKALCGALKLSFNPDMLSWSPGGNPADGVWAPVWYDAVHASAGFAGMEGRLPNLQTSHQINLLDETLPFYELMAAQKL